MGGGGGGRDGCAYGQGGRLGRAPIVMVAGAATAVVHRQNLHRYPNSENIELILNNEIETYN